MADAGENRFGRALINPAGLILVLLAAMWAAEIADYLLPYNADALGIAPRTASGLIGVVLAPFLHAGFGHLVANSVPFCVLGLAVALRAGPATARIVVLIVVAGGLGVWLLGPADTIVVGASGLIFGLMGYLVAAGVITRHPLDIVLAVLVLLVYGGGLLAATPFGAPAGVSWLAHLSGFAAGVIAARLYAPRSRSVGS